MTTTAAQRGWGSPGEPGSIQGTQYYRDHIVRVEAGGVVLWVHHEIASLVKGFLNEIVAKGYPLSGRADDWGWAHRYIRGYEHLHRLIYLSNHSWGLALDLNAITNPMTEDGRVHSDMPAWVIAVAIKWGFSWGGNYRGRRKDPMHFEFLGTPADAARLVQALYVLDFHGIKEQPVSFSPITVKHPVHGFVVIMVDGSTRFNPDNRSPLNKDKKRVGPRYLGGMNRGKFLKARAYAPKTPPNGGYFVRDGRLPTNDWALVITYADAAYYQLASDGSDAKG